MKKWILSVTCMLTLIGCSSPKKEKDTVLVSFSPYTTIVKEIVGETLDVHSIVPDGYNLHVFEPSPKEIVKYEKAKIFFGVGETFEKKFIKAAKENNKNFHYVNLANSLPYLIHDSHEHHEHDDHSHYDHSSYDTHIWMDPILMISQVRQIQQTLSELFPRHTSVFNENAKHLEKQLLTLDKEIKKELTGTAGDAVIVSHPALGYFCKRYDLKQISFEMEGKDPLPRDIEKIFQKIKKEHVLCSFSQVGHSNKATTLIAQKLNIPNYHLEPNNPNYEDNLLKIATQIKGSND